MKPKVSVIYPVYNVEKYIKESILSILTQEFIDFELIVINDGSRDSSISIALEILKDYSVPYKIIAQENKGLSNARNTGLLHAAGEYVTFIDSDDILSHNHLKLLVDGLNKFDSQIIFSRFQYVKENNRFGDKVEKTGIFKKLNYPNQLRFNGLLRGFVHCSSLLVSKELLTSIGLKFDETLRFGEDRIFILLLFSSNTSVIELKKKTYKYLIRDNSIMSSVKFHQMLQLLGKIKQSYYIVNKDNKRIVDNYVYRVCFGLTNQLFRTSTNFNYASRNARYLLDYMNYNKFSKVAFIFIGSLIYLINPRKVDHSI